MKIRERRKSCEKLLHQKVGLITRIREAIKEAGKQLDHCVRSNSMLFAYMMRCEFKMMLDAFSLFPVTLKPCGEKRICGVTLMQSEPRDLPPSSGANHHQNDAIDSLALSQLSVCLKTRSALIGLLQLCRALLLISDVLVPACSRHLLQLHQQSHTHAHTYTHSPLAHFITDPPPLDCDLLNEIWRNVQLVAALLRQIPFERLNNTNLSITSSAEQWRGFCPLTRLFELKHALPGLLRDPTRIVKMQQGGAANLKLMPSNSRVEFDWAEFFVPPRALLDNQLHHHRLHHPHHHHEQFWLDTIWPDSCYTLSANVRNKRGGDDDAIRAGNGGLRQIMKQQFDEDEAEYLQISAEDIPASSQQQNHQLQQNSNTSALLRNTVEDVIDQIRSGFFNVF